MKKMALLTEFFLLSAIFIGCGSQSLPVEKTISSEPVAQESKAISKESWEKKWESTIANARKEGKVVLYGGSVIKSIKEAVNNSNFREKYGFVPDGIVDRGAVIATKIITERRVGLFIPDVYVSGLNTVFDQLKPARVIVPLEPVLILPEVVDQTKWYGGKLRWGDADRLVFSPFAFTIVPLAINTELVKPGEIKSYYDLLNPKWKGKILMNDPALAGTGLKGFSVVGFHILNLDFFRSLVKQDPMIIKDNRLMVDWLAKGKYSILIFPQSESMKDYIAAGAPVAYVSPVEGTYLSSGGSPVALIDKAPHPNAAKVFINWYLSREGQTLVSKIHSAQSARVDVSIDGLDPLTLRQTGVNYFLDSETEKWLARDQEFIGAAMEIFGHLMR